MTAPRTTLRQALLAAALTAALAGCATGRQARADFAYLPLWPFTSTAEADAATGGWHADPAATALRFTRDFLGFTELDRSTRVEVDGDQAWVGVGATLPDGRPRTAATVHLARFGTTADAPWVVVGTRDSVLTLDAPAYGSPVATEIDAGGTISGVDESLHLQVRQAGRPDLLGESCCLSTGGQNTPWTYRVTYRANADGADDTNSGPITLVVSTGGHVAEVETFAVTGLRVG